MRHGWRGTDGHQNTGCIYLSIDPLVTRHSLLQHFVTLVPRSWPQSNAARDYPGLSAATATGACAACAGLHCFMPDLARAMNMLASYVRYTHLDALPHLSAPGRVDPAQFMRLAPEAVASLELLVSNVCDPCWPRV